MRLLLSGLRCCVCSWSPDLHIYISASSSLNLLLLHSSRPRLRKFPDPLLQHSHTASPFQLLSYLNIIKNQKKPKKKASLSQLLHPFNCFLNSDCFPTSNCFRTVVRGVLLCSAALCCCCCFHTTSLYTTSPYTNSTSVPIAIRGAPPLLLHNFNFYSHSLQKCSAAASSQPHPTTRLLHNLA